MRNHVSYLEFLKKRLIIGKRGSSSYSKKLFPMTASVFSFVKAVSRDVNPRLCVGNAALLHDPPSWDLNTIDFYM